MTALRDRFGRPVTKMRISVTLRCNHRCIFCHREGISKVRLYELSPSEIGFVAEVASELGIRDFKVTGGEPLIREDIVEVISYLSRHGDRVSITTNGSLLSKYAYQLKEAGLSYANVSLHSLNNEVFRKITGGDLSNVINGILSAVEAGITVKLDYLVLKWNSSEFREILNFASKLGLNVNVIELIPLGLAFKSWKELHVPIDPIEGYLEKTSVKKIIRRFQNRPTYVLPTGISVTLVKGYENPELCSGCDRIRLTPDGRIKTCIYRDDLQVDLLPAIKARDRQQLENLLRKAVEIREPYFKE